MSVENGIRENVEKGVEENKRDAERQFGGKVTEIVNESMIFENVDMDAVLDIVQGKFEGVTSEKMREIASYYFKDRKKGDAEFLKYMSDVLELDSLPRLGEFDDDRWKVDALHRKGEIWLSHDLRRPIERIQLIAHESFHEYQKKEKAIQNDARARMYEENYKNYIKASKDEKGYYDQLVEREAYIFGLAVSNFYNDVTRNNRQFHPREEEFLHKRAVKEALKTFQELSEKTA